MSNGINYINRHLDYIERLAPHYWDLEFVKACRIKGFISPTIKIINQLELPVSNSFQKTVMIHDLLHDRDECERLLKKLKS